jgi:hypothetical protein
MVGVMEPPTFPCSVAGNYEPDDESEIICPHCHKASGWDKLLWSGAPPEGGFYCNACGNNFTPEQEQNNEADMGIT